jgi:hypothetical protein
VFSIPPLNVGVQDIISAFPLKRRDVESAEVI